MSSKKPLIVAGGGVHFSEATQMLDQIRSEKGYPVCEIQAGKGSLAYDHPCCVSAIGATGILAANILERKNGSCDRNWYRYSDFTTASKTIFRNPKVKFVNINVFEMDAHKHNGDRLK